MRRPSQTSEASIRSWAVPGEWHEGDARDARDEWRHEGDAREASSSSSFMTIPDLHMAPSLGGTSTSDHTVMPDMDDLVPSLVELVARILGLC